MYIICTICTDPVNPADYLNVINCGHMFHCRCLEQWILRSKTCPQCRQEVSYERMYRVYPTMSDEPRDTVQEEIEPNPEPDKTQENEELIRLYTAELDNRNFELIKLKSEYLALKRMHDVNAADIVYLKNAKRVMNDEMKRQNTVYNELREQFDAQHSDLGLYIKRNNHLTHKIDVMEKEMKRSKEQLLRTYFEKIALQQEQGIINNKMADIKKRIKEGSIGKNEVCGTYNTIFATLSKFFDNNIINMDLENVKKLSKILAEDVVRQNRLSSSYVEAPTPKENPKSNLDCPSTSSNSEVLINGLPFQDWIQKLSEKSSITCGIVPKTNETATRVSPSLMKRFDSERSSVQITTVNRSTSKQCDDVKPSTSQWDSRVGKEPLPPKPICCSNNHLCNKDLIIYPSNSKPFDCVYHTSRHGDNAYPSTSKEIIPRNHITNGDLTVYPTSKQFNSVNLSTSKPLENLFPSTSKRPNSHVPSGVLGKPLSHMLPKGTTIVPKPMHFTNKNVVQSSKVPSKGFVFSPPVTSNKQWQDIVRGQLSKMPATDVFGFSSKQTNNASNRHASITLTPSKQPDNAQPSTSKQSNIVYPSTSKQPDKVYPSTSKQPDKVYPSTSKQPDNAQPSTSKQTNIVYPSTSKQPDNVYPSTSKQPDNVYPSTSKQPDKVYPSTSKQPDKVYPSTSKQPEKVYPSTSKQPDNVFPSTSKQPDVFPSTSKQPDNVFPSTSKRPDNVFPSTSKQPDNVFPSTSKQPDNVFPSTSKQPDNVFPSTSKQPDNVFPSTSKQPDVFPSTSKQPDNVCPSTSKQPDVFPSTSKQPENVFPSTSKQPDNVFPSSSKQPDNVFPSTSKQPDNVFPSTSKQSDNVFPSTLKQPDVFPSTSKQPENVFPSTSKQPDVFPSTSKQPDNVFPSTSKQPDNVFPSTSKQPDNVFPSTSKQPDNVFPSTSKQPDNVFPSTSKQDTLTNCHVKEPLTEILPKIDALCLRQHSSEVPSALKSQNQKYTYFGEDCANNNAVNQFTNTGRESILTVENPRSEQELCEYLRKLNMAVESAVSRDGAETLLKQLFDILPEVASVLQNSNVDSAACDLIRQVYCAFKKSELELACEPLNEGIVSGMLEKHFGSLSVGGQPVFTFQARKGVSDVSEAAKLKKKSAQLPLNHVARSARPEREEQRYVKARRVNSTAAKPVPFQFKPLKPE
ncbi:proteoglycan 4 isoform X2 [Amyelois transitella]|nr:proteoglycan 4 isoform X2 [Amyelois transitella]